MYLVWNKKLVQFLSLVLLRYESPPAASLRYAETPMKILAHNMGPYIMVDNTTGKIDGFLADVWSLIEISNNFNSEVLLIDNYNLGIDLISKGEADVMLAAVIAKNTIENVQYTHPYFSNWYHLSMRKPTARASSNAYIKSFDFKLWIASVAMFVLMTSLIWVTTKILNSILRHEPSYSLIMCFLSVMSGFSNQGLDLKLRCYSSRMQTLLYLVFGVILLAALNAILVSRLAFVEVKFPFEDEHEILSSSYSLCMRNNSFVYNYFLENNKSGEVVRKEWRKFLNGPGCLDLLQQENLKKILCQKRLVILENRVVMENTLKNNKIECELIKNSRKLYVKSNSFIMSARFPYNEDINKILIKMMSAGILRKLEIKWIKSYVEREFTNDKMVKASLDHISGILFIYLGCVGFSFGIFLIEIWSNRKKTLY